MVKAMKKYDSRFSTADSIRLKSNRRHKQKVSFYYLPRRTQAQEASSNLQNEQKMEITALRASLEKRGKQVAEHMVSKRPRCVVVVLACVG